MPLSEKDVVQTLMHTRHRVSAVAWVVVRDTHAAEDIFQNVMLKALTKDVIFEAEGAVLSWAFVTARREGLDWLRRHRRETLSLDADIIALLDREWLAEPMSGAGARLEALQERLQSIPEKSRDLLHLRYFEGRGCEEVATRLGSGLDAIYKRLSRLHEASRVHRDATHAIGGHPGMSDPNMTRELLLRHLDGKVTAAETAQVAELLRTDPAARAFLREVAEQAVMVAEIERTAQARRGETGLHALPAKEGSARRPQSEDWRWITALAAAVLLLAGAGIWWAAEAGDDARITEVSGPLQWTGDGGQVLRELPAGSIVSGGTLESLSVESWVVFKFRDGSQVTMSGQSVVTIAEQRQKVLHLRHGSLSASVAPQAKERPMLVHTPAADLAVLGTQFNVKADSAYTALRVNEGRVRVTRLVDGRIADVPTQHHVVASIDQSTELLATKPSAPVDAWSSKLPAGATYGKWRTQDDGRPGALQAEPLFLKKTKFGPLVLFVTAVSVSSGDAPPVLLTPDSRFRIRGRLPTAGDVFFGITTNFSQWRMRREVQHFAPRHAGSGCDGKVRARAAFVGPSAGGTALAAECRRADDGGLLVPHGAYG